MALFTITIMLKSNQLIIITTSESSTAIHGSNHNWKDYEYLQEFNGARVNNAILLENNVVIDSTCNIAMNFELCYN